MTRISDAETLAEWTMRAIDEQRYELAAATARLMVQAYRVERDSRMAPAVPVAVPVVPGAGEAPLIYSAMRPCTDCGGPCEGHYPAAQEAPTAVTPSARCTFPVSPGTECHRVLYWQTSREGQGVVVGEWQHLDGSSDHAPTPDRFL